MTDIIVDARGHRCPVPSLRLQKALETTSPGATIVLLADDPMARIDVPHLIGGGPHRLISIEDVGGYLSFRVATAAPPG